MRRNAQCSPPTKTYVDITTSPNIANTFNSLEPRSRGNKERWINHLARSQDGHMKYRSKEFFDQTIISKSSCPCDCFSIGNINHNTTTQSCQGCYHFLILFLWKVITTKLYFVMEFPAHMHVLDNPSKDSTNSNRDILLCIQSSCKSVAAQL